MKKVNSDRLTPQQRAETDALAALPEDQIDTSDIPEQRDWSDARRGALFRPVKQQITLRLDADVIDWFRRHADRDEGYQTRINRALREYVMRRDRDERTASTKLKGRVPSAAKREKAASKGVPKGRPSRSTGFGAAAPGRLKSDER
jgi:uncharacterized protein (DUF4415 family)